MRHAIPLAVLAAALSLLTFVAGTVALLAAVLGVLTLLIWGWVLTGSVIRWWRSRGLEPGDAVRSPNGAHELVMTSSGRLRLRTGGTIVWEPNYSPTSTARIHSTKLQSSRVPARRGSWASRRAGVWQGDEGAPDHDRHIVDWTGQHQYGDGRGRRSRQPDPAVAVLR